MTEVGEIVMAVHQRRYPVMSPWWSIRVVPPRFSPPLLWKLAIRPGSWLV